MKRRIAIVLAALLLMSASAGCTEKQEDERTGSDPAVIIFENDFMIFNHSLNYEMYKEEGEPGSERVFTAIEGIGLFAFQMYDKSGETLKERSEYYEKKYDNPEENFGYIKTEDMNADGKAAKYIVFGKDEQHISFLIVDYSEDHFIVFDFFIEEGESTDQIISDIIKSIKFK